MGTAERMMRLFAGYSGAHGTHGAMKRNDEKGGKLEIKQSVRTLREPVTLDLWEKHLIGEYYLGVIPITEEGESHFGCIDVDRYDVNLAEVAIAVRKRSLPMVVCRSKSGGAHVYMFLSQPVPAATLRAKLRQIAASMGWGDCEIFPKQNQILGDRGDLGNWLNMPYQNAQKPDRYAVKETSAAMTVGEFLDYAESHRTTLDFKETVVQDEGLEDGPPCLQHLCGVGFPAGQGNNGFFALATFCKKKFGQKWREMLEEYNRRYFSPPRPADEVADVMRRMEGKDYNYRCKDQPIVSYCNVALCKSRKFGVGGSGQWPTVSGLSKLDTEPPLWFLDIEDRRIELTTKQLRDYREFQLICMEQLTVTYMPMKTDTWLEIVGGAMESALIIEAPPEMSIGGHFMELLEDFCTDRHRGEKKEDLWLGKPWFDEESGRHYFRLSDLMKHLEREGFKHWGRNALGQRIENMGGGKHFFNVKGRGVNVFWVPGNFSAPPDVPLPKTRREPI